jgi:hypothetical protein
VTYTVEIPNWHPRRLNELLCDWRKRARLKKADREVVYWAVRNHGLIPLALQRRRVSLTITLGPRQRAGDPDAYWKSTLDALVHARMLTDDNRQGVELGPVAFRRGPARATTLTLEDVP